MASAAFFLASLVVFGNFFASQSMFPPMLIQDLAKILLDNYCSPEKLSGMKEVIEAASANTDILSIPDPEALATVLTDGVQNTIADSRLLVSYEPHYTPPKPQAFAALPPEHLIGMIQSSIKFQVLENDVGYLRIDHIIDEEVADKIGGLLVQHVWNKILPTSALIFDLRYTSSGELSGLPYVVSYFTNAEPLIHIDSVYNRPSNATTGLWSRATLLGERYGTTKPLILLTSGNTKGAAEAVTYALKNLKRATVVGERTAGGSAKIQKFKVGDSDFYVSIPVARSVSPITGKSWEVAGVTPDVEVNAEDALDAAMEIVKLRAQIPGVIAVTAALVTDNYAFEEVGADVAKRLAAAVGEYSLINSKEELEAKLSSDLMTLSGDKSLKAVGKISAPPPMNYTPEMYIQLIKVSFSTDVLENNIGYLRFDMFGDFEQVAAIAQIIVEHVWKKVIDTDALIIDLRNNLGGPTTSIAGFCSYFFGPDRPILLDKIFNRPTGNMTEMWTLPQLTGERYGTKKPLLILTSSVTAGAAEEFVYILKKLGRAMIVGEATAGGSHPAKTFRVGESDIFLSVPVDRSDTAHGPAWEGAGIAPHIPVPADVALDTAKGILNKQFFGQK